MSFSRTQKFAAAAMVALLTMSVIGWKAIDASRFSSVASMRADYESKVAMLAVRSRTDSSLPEKEERFRAALLKSDYPDATRIAAEVSGSDEGALWSASPFAEFMTGVVDLNTLDMEKQLDYWVQASKPNWVSLAVRAQYEYAFGWHLRGNGFSSDVPAADQLAFQKYMEKSLSDVNAAIGVQRNPSASLYFLKLQIQQSLGSPQDRQDTFAIAIKAHPKYYPLYQIMLATLQPKWGGSIEAMYKFVEAQAGAADRYSPLRMLYVDLYKDIVNVASVSCGDASVSAKDKSACRSAAMAGFGGDDFSSNLRGVFLLYNHLDRYQFGEAIRSPIQSVMSMRTQDPLGSSMLQTAAEIMGSNTRLVESDGRKNDYVIDELVAESWYRAGHYENALKKDREALADLENTRFPNGEARDRAQARIYVQMSATLGRLHDYVGQAAYEKASFVLGGRNGYEHAICFAFFKAAASEEILPACDEAIAANGDEIETYYWRAQALIDRKQGNKAIPDLERVARSRDSLRALSAINLSMIWFNNNDNDAALKVLNGYLYLYDERADSRENIAIAYNNRCYAYMQLGDLRKALSDCDRSLSYGQIPDAYAKKNELQRRLSGLPI